MADEVQELSELDAVAEQIEQQESAAEPEPEKKSEESDIPEEFRGKSFTELARIASHSRREMGRMGNELGEIRKLADELIKSQLQPKPKEQETQPEVDFFENPQEAIRRAVESNPKVRAAEQYALQVQQEMARQKLAQLHPDYGQIIGDQGFREWVGASPVRQRLLKDADQFDVNAAHELFSTFKELKAARQANVANVDKTSRNQALNAAAVDTGGTGETSRKIYRRADLIQLQIKNPAKYKAMSDEIMTAYAEGRVR